ncbi:RHS repeat-associated protein [Haloactinospora alba]|uniref:RHS repeat-associated protein n=1 Tax=Haloactinospora alba TaxID=405555 RepID=A0A543NMD2_9ACTN|nr:RHS repeat-associated core domain-containing protein [Haloactinospora alba]TQN32979.1 RHS repeat-associated protein [Haloactinospora alba]
MPTPPDTPVRPRSRGRSWFTQATAFILVAGLISVMPASAVAYNDRPDVPEQESVAGKTAAPDASGADDAVDEAAVTELEDADWPDRHTVELAPGSGSPEPRTFRAPDNSDGTVATLGAVDDDTRSDWESPLSRGEDDPGRHNALAPRQPEPSPEASPSAAPEPSASPSAPPSPDPTSGPGTGEDSGSEPEDAPSESTPEETPDDAPAEETPEREHPREVADAELEVLGREAAQQAGIDGVLMRLTRTDGGDAAGPVAVGLDYSGFSSAFGGNYGSRLELVALDDCTEESGDPRDCSATAELDSTNDAESQTVRAVAPATDGDGTLLAATADEGDDDSSGDYTATKLSSSYEWNVGLQTGDFSWSYPMSAPAVAGDLAPDVALNYSAQSVDGRTASTNNQTSWIGEGFDYDPGYIERKFKLCDDDGKEVADQCWGRENATMMLDGSSTELFVDEDGEWHARDDDGATVEKLTGGNNGDNNGEYWKVTTTDGTQYYFGRNRLPGWTSGDPETRSALTTPVYGNDSGEPCHASTFDESWCQQAYRWNLDYVVNPRGNAMAYYYEQETNNYGRNLGDEATPYDRASHLKRIEYGLREDDVFATAPARVQFDVSERCIPTDGFDCSAGKRSDDNADHWPDTPLDRECDGDTCPDTHSATFWSTKKLDTVTTQVHDGNEYTAVDSWDLQHEFPDSGDGTDPDLWLASVSHTGHVGGTASDPDLTFGGTAMPNRVDSTSDGLAPMRKWRMTSVYTETGGQIDVTYSDQQCSPDDTPDPDSNSEQCYPTIWTPEGGAELTDWFHKYTVTQVAQKDLVAQQPTVLTSYEYDNPGWHYDDPDGIVPEERKTWSQFRGFETVTVRKGHPDQTRTETQHRFFRGMDGDNQESGSDRSVKVTDSEGDSVTDHDAYNGMTREVITRDGPGGDVVEKTITTPWKNRTAERDYDWGTLRAHITKTETTEEYTPTSDGRQVTRTTRSFDEHGFVTETDDQGDTSTSDDDRCTRVEYARAPDKGILDTVRREETVAASCDATPDRPADVVSDDRTLYDSGDYGDAPSQGLVTGKQRVAEYTDGDAQYETTEQTTHDTYGRELTSTDALDNTTTTEYSGDTTGGAATTVTTTNPLGHTTEKHLDARSQTVAEIDADGNRTDVEYDPLGRITAVWLPDRSRERDESANKKFEYNVRKDEPTSVVTRELNENAEYITRYVIFDGLLRERQTQEPAPGGGRAITGTLYDSRGNAVVERDTYYNEKAPEGALFAVNNTDEIPRQTEKVYDGAGRVTDELQVSRGEEQWRTTTQHLGDRTKRTVPEGGTGTTEITDARGRTVEKRDHHGRKPEGEYDATTYTYGKHDKVATMTDPSGATWTYTYDLRGRKVEQTDPDVGTTTITYDSLDRKTTITDGRGETLAYTYDALGREVEMRDDSPDGDLRAEWEYDTEATGELTSSTRHSGGDEYTSRVLNYDERDRPTEERISIPASEGKLAGDYDVSTNYNPDGSVSSTELPAAGDLRQELVINEYDDIGNPTKLTTTDGDVVTGTLYTKTGKLAQREFSRGGFYSEKTWETRDYEEATDRLSEDSVVHETGSGSLSTRTYTYDDIGNIQRLTDNPTSDGLPSDTQCFDYDHQRRLTEAWTPDSSSESACQNEPDSSALGGVAPYWNSYTYDAVGNRLQETRREGNGTTVREYTIAGQESGPQHGVSSVAESGPEGESTSSYSYDDAGNMVSRDTEDGKQELTYNAEGNLVNVSGGTETDYVYDADDERLLRRAGATTTLYLPGMEVSFTAGEDSTEAKRFYEHGGDSVAVRRNDGSLHWTFNDYNGTGTLSMDADTGATVQRWFSPFGQLRGEDASAGSGGQWPSDKGFVGGTDDSSTGLTQLGERAYDAALGRFLSVDPLMLPGNAQQMHGYAYANNNPISMSDPSGLMMLDSGCCASTSNDPPRGISDIRQIKQEAMWTQQGRDIEKMRQNSGVYQRPYYQNKQSSFYTGASASGGVPYYGNPSGGGSSSGGSPAPSDPYSGPATDPDEEARDNSKSWYESAADFGSSAWDWTKDNWEGVATAGVLGVCVAASGGACLAAGAGLVGAQVTVDAVEKNGDITEMDWGRHGVNSALLGAGGAFSKWAVSGRVFSRSGWGKFAKSGPREKILPHDKGAAHRGVGSTHLGMTTFNMGVNGASWTATQGASEYFN